MSASLYYTLAQKKNYLDVSPSVRDLVYKKFNGQLSIENLQTLQAMYEASEDKSYLVLIELVEKYEHVNLSIEW